MTRKEDGTRRRKVEQARAEEGQDGYSAIVEQIIFK